MTAKATAIAQSARAPPTEPPTIAPMLDGGAVGSADDVVDDVEDVLRVIDVGMGEEVVEREGTPMDRGTSVMKEVWFK
jgi:hypothetical protein